MLFASTDLASKRYSVRALGWLAAYVAMLVIANWLFKSGFADGPLAFAVALLPAVPVIGVIAAIGQLLIEQNDEYLRMLLVRKTLIATAFMLASATAWGFLEDFDLVPHVPAFYAAVLWFAGLGLGGCVNAMIERSRGGE